MMMISRLQSSGCSSRSRQHCNCQSCQHHRIGFRMVCSSSRPAQLLVLVLVLVVRQFGRQTGNQLTASAAQLQRDGWAQVG
jgi:hypothetical protein